MPIMLPAPGLFSTTNGCANDFEKSAASTRATMSVPPPGGEGTTMRTARVGYSWASAVAIQNRTRNLAHRTLAPFGGNQDESDHARLGSAVDPVVHGVLLHQHVALPQPHDFALELHLDLARQHDRVVDSLGAMVTRRNAGLVSHQPECDAVVPFPQVQALVPGPGRGCFSEHFVDRYDRTAALVVVGDYAPDRFHVIKVWPRRRAAG